MDPIADFLEEEEEEAGEEEKDEGVDEEGVDAGQSQELIVER